MAVKAIWKFQRPLCSPLNRHFRSPNLHHVHHCTIVKLLRKQDWAYLLRISFPHSSEQKAISSLYFFVSTYGFQQCLCCDQAITMICRGHVINKMANVYKKNFPSELCCGWVTANVTCCKCEKSSCGFNIFYSRSSFLDYAGLRVKALPWLFLNARLTIN